MSLTVGELMKLPSLQGAKVVAGHKGLDKDVSIVSVLEYTQVNQFKDVHADYFGNEILITAFYTLKDSVEKQCEVVEALNRKKVGGLIIFYLGVIMPFLDERVIATADSLGFPIITMPENRHDLRYGEVIYEAMEAILKSRFLGQDFKNTIIEQVSQFPPESRSVGTVMRMLSDKTHSTIILADSSGAPYNASVWPRNLTTDNFLSDGLVQLSNGFITLLGEIYQVSSYPVKPPGGPTLNAVIFKRGDPLSPDVTRQMGEVLQISTNLWSRGYGENLLSEIVGAILKDEPYTVSRISALFGIRMRDIRDMWIINPLGAATVDTLMKRVPRLLSEELSHMCATVVFDTYNDSIVALMSQPQNGASLVTAAQSFIESLGGAFATVTVCRGLDSPEHVRKAYYANMDALSTSRELFPLKRLFMMSDIRFADKCKKIIEGGEASISHYTDILGSIPSTDGITHGEMLKTLTTYYLDAQANISQTGDILFLHKNTIQYRMRKFKEKSLYGMDTFPETIELYTALALSRILDGNGGRGG